MTVGVYVHVPFCVSKCNYCDFYSESLKPCRVNNFLNGIKQEMTLLCQHMDMVKPKYSTLYLGGGTPSLLTAEQLQQLLHTVKKGFTWSDKSEITIEVNPGTITKEKLIRIIEMGINRISIGVQSFNDMDLIAMGRKHTATEVRELVNWLRELKFVNFSLDLIYGLPNQTLDQWRSNLLQAIALEPKHISLYGLRLEENTPWGQMVTQGALKIPQDDQQADMYQLAVSLLVNSGFNHYEISNFSKTGYESIHNTIYWQGGHYIGLGPGASSFYKDKRWNNIPHLAQYTAKLLEKKLPVEQTTQLTPADLEAEGIFLGLRLMDGINISQFNLNFQVNFIKKYNQQLDKLTKLNLLKIENNNVKLTLTGVLLANEIFIEFLPDN